MEFLKNLIGFDVSSTIHNVGIALAIFAGLLAILIVLFCVWLLAQLVKPIASVVRWLFGITEGTPPSDIALGVSHGFRMVLWACLAGGVALLVLVVSS